MGSRRLLERFLRYVQVDTTARDNPTSYPSSPGQWELGKMLVAELEAMGLRDAQQDQYGMVTATLAPTSNAADNPIVWCAHLDTSPEVSGRGVRPQVVAPYSGGDLVLPGDPTQVLRREENPELDQLVGSTLITTDGTTLLGADDKAGIAVILEAAERLLEEPQRARPTIRLLLTCDEEIGHGVDYVEVPKLNARACYTLDGPGSGQIDVETFSADLVIVQVHGQNIHPAIAKGRMVNAVRAASWFVDQLPRTELSPETTEGEQGFLHPIHIQGGVERTNISLLLRDFQTARLDEYFQRLIEIARRAENEFPGLKINLERKAQYRNLAEGLRKEPRAVDYAVRAFRRLGIEPRLTRIRGGTDGCRLTEQGLPTPNLSTGQHNPHSPLEWASLDEMETAVKMLVELAEVWAEVGD